MPHRYKWLGTLVASAALVYSSFASASSIPTAQAQSAGPCGIANPAFCDTFDAPQVNGGRGGPMDPIWGVSRVTGNSNLNNSYENAWADTDIKMCDGSVKRVSPPNDIQICNGTLHESMNDTGMNNLAMYPRQPFDIAGRTGTVSFDVSNDSGGGHQAWPAFSFTDQPIPAPLVSVGAFPGSLYPRNSLTLEFDGYNGTCTSLGHATITANWVATDINYTFDDCVLPPAQESFVMNHIQIKLNQSSFEVWMSDAGSQTLKKVAHASGFTMPLSRGLVWMRDVHYSGNKICETDPHIFCQAMHTFAWDNFGFDGPVLPRDVGVQLPDRLLLTDGINGADNGYPVRQLGWALNQGVNPPGLHHEMDFSGAQALHDVDKASAALLELVYDSSDTAPFHYAINGHAPHDRAWNPALGPHCCNTEAIEVPLNELVNGDNHIDFWEDGSFLFGLSEIDMILVGAGGGGSSTNPPPTATPLPNATATPPPNATATPVPTSGATGHQFNRTLNLGDSIHVTCSSGTLTIVSQSNTSDVLACK